MVRLVPNGGLGIGVQLPVQSQSRVFVEEWELSAGPDEIVAVAKKADEHGFLYVGVCDHLGIPEDRAAKMGDVWYDPLTTLAYIAAETTQVRLLTHVYVLALRHPLLAAKAFATLDRLSGGRVIIGVGAGHVEQEFQTLGEDFGNRGGRTDEAIDALRCLLGEQQPATFQGEHYVIDNLHVAPAPIQQPVPIWIGGSGRPALRRAAARGDGWIPQGTLLKDMPEHLTYLRDHLDGRDESDLDLGGMALPMYVGEPSWDVGRWTSTGSPEELAAGLRAFAEHGCSHVQVRFRSRSVEELLDQFDQFAAEVMPRLQR